MTQSCDFCFMDADYFDYRHGQFYCRECHFDRGPDPDDCEPA